MEYGFNLNQYIKVKLTPKGMDIFYCQYDELIKNGAKFERKMPEIDSDGYTKFEAWQFIKLYGEHLRFGCNDLPFSMNILIDDKYLYKTSIQHESLI